MSMSAMTSTRLPNIEITEALIADLARRADVDPRSVLKALAGSDVRGRAGARIERVLAELRGRA
jgi:hypothetical protein